jgi:prepilin-type N-terminal cleavage/methylation domain-containing protein
MKRGFTLIELLIVVAIIAILAAIAVPNFLEAQVRAKVSRAKSDLRNLATALESYHVDINHYPPYGDIPIVWAQGTDPQVLEPRFVTTPVAYMTGDAALNDPFTVNKQTTWFSKFYNYVNFDDARYKDTAFVHERYGEYRLTSAGPDRLYFNANLTGGFAVITYDATNGTVSVGDIYRSNKFPEPKWHY